MSKPKISVIIGTFNQENCIKLVLDSFLNQTIPQSDYEVIVVDSSSTDGSFEIYDQYQAASSIRFIIQENNGKTAARNTGVQAAQSDLLLITDADMIADKHLLETHIKAHQSTQTPSCFEGVTNNLKVLEWPTTEANLDPYIKEKIKDGKKIGWWYFLTGNISFSKALFLQENGFSERFKGYGWEDLELGYRLSKKSVPLIYLKNAINYHYHVITKDEEIERCIKKGESAQVFLKLHPELKWFLGLNPVSKWLFPKIKQSGWFYTKIVTPAYRSKAEPLHQFGFWFLKEWHYLKGVLGF